MFPRTHFWQDGLQVALLMAVVLVVIEQTIGFLVFPQLQLLVELTVVALISHTRGLSYLPDTCQAP